MESRLVNREEVLTRFEQFVNLKELKEFEELAKQDPELGDL